MLCTLYRVCSKYLSKAAILFDARDREHCSVDRGNASRKEQCCSIVSNTFFAIPFGRNDFSESGVRFFENYYESPAIQIYTFQIFKSICRLGRATEVTWFQVQKLALIFFFFFLHYLCVFYSTRGIKVYKEPYAGNKWLSRKRILKFQPMRSRAALHREGMELTNRVAPTGNAAYSD